MSRTEAQRRARCNYTKKSTSRRSVVFYPKDADLLARYDAQESKQEYVRRLIREDMEREERGDAAGSGSPAKEEPDIDFVGLADEMIGRMGRLNEVIDRSKDDPEYIRRLSDLYSACTLLRSMGIGYEITFSSVDGYEAIAFPSNGYVRQVPPHRLAEHIEGMKLTAASSETLFR